MLNKQDEIRWRRGRFLLAKVSVLSEIPWNEILILKHQIYLHLHKLFELTRNQLKHQTKKPIITNF